MQSTKPFTLDDLDPCETWNDAHELFNVVHIEDLVEFVSAVTNAKKYISLTARDAFLLQVAESRLHFRTGNMTQDEWLESVNRQAAQAQAKFLAYCEKQEAEKI